ncbi:MAG: BrnT family toxin [Rubrivivax sp.]|nr:BrnT family toxin [Rubrivivax sp.]
MDAIRVGPRKGCVEREESPRHLRSGQDRFHDDFAIQFLDDEHSSHDDRFLLLGLSSDAKLLLVCHCETEDGDVIRIIYARKATVTEARHYRGR